jgi:hypothetical protein
MRPLALIATGLVIVAIDPRTEYLDLLPDVLGWGAVALGAWRLGFSRAAAAAGATAIVCVAELSLPYRWIRVDARTGEPVAVAPGSDSDAPQHLVFDDLTGWRLAVAALATVAAGVALWMLLGGLATRAAAWERPRVARQLAALRWLAIAAWVAPVGVVIASEAGGDGSYDPVWNGRLELLAIAGLAILAWLVVLLIAEHNRAWAMPATDRASPWSRQR